MAERGGSAIWPARLRWRLRGAWLWPLFWALTMVDALLLQVRPVAGTSGPSFWGAVLLAWFFNLVTVAVLGRGAAWWLRRRRPDMPNVVAEDRAGSALLALVTAAVIVAGVIHAPARDAARRAERAQSDAVRAYVLAHGGALYRAGLAHMDTEQQAGDFFRTCVPGEGVRPLCLLVDTSHDPPIVHLDHDRTPNRHL